MKAIKILLLMLIIVGCSNDSDSISGATDGKGGSLAIFALKGDYLYTVDHMNLNVFSLINTSQPTKVNQKQIGFEIETLFANGDYLFVGSRSGMFIYSIQNPENPEKLSSVQHFTACDPVVANDTHAFVTLHSNTSCGNNTNVLQVYDTSNLLSPTLIHSRNLTEPKGLGLYNNYLIVCDYQDIKFFDISNPAEPFIVSSLLGQCYDVAIIGDDLYAVGKNVTYRYLLDANNITNPILRSVVMY